MSYKKIGLGLTIISVFIGGTGLAINVNKNYPKPLVDREARFSCNLEPDADRGGEVWTVKYQIKEKKSEPWLKIVTSFGDEWTESVRCDEIARRLEMFRQDGLMKIFSRKDINTPGQEVICAQTKVSGESCPLLITLKPGVDGYKALRQMAASLVGGYSVYQNTDEKTPQNFTPQNPVIDVTQFLASDDR